MIIIVCEGRKLAKFESWEGNKAMDWITQKGLFRKERIPTCDSTYWMCEALPKCGA